MNRTVFGEVNQFISNTKEYLISDEALRYFQIIITISVRGFLIFGGLFTNFFNVIIYFRLGLNSSMKVAIFVTSFSDATVSFMMFVATLCHLVKELEQDSDIDLDGFSLYVLEDTAYIIFLASCWVTAFMSVERCCCVLFPFKVKAVFTIRRSVVTIVIIYLVAITTNLHMLYGIRKVQLEVEANSTSAGISQWMLVYSDPTESAVWGFVEYIFSGLVLFVMCQVVLLLSSILMMYGLKKSSLVRDIKVKNYTLLPRKVKDENMASNLTISEKKLVKLVLMLSILMIVCNMPRLIAFTIYYIVGEAEYNTYQNLNTLTWEVVVFFGTFISVGNFFIYLKLNSMFRQYFYNLFSKICVSIV